jgi:hypothetical protein
MRRFPRAMVLGLLWMSYSKGYSQSVVPSLSNILRYGYGSVGIKDAPENFTYIENLTDLRLAFPPYLVSGIRLLYDGPPERGPAFQGVKRMFLEFSKDELSVRGGNFSQLCGRGLVVNLFEDRGLAYDTWMNGVKAEYTGGLVHATVFGGTLNFWDSVTVARTEQYKIRSANAEVHVIDGILVGGTYLGTDGVIPQLSSVRTLRSDISEAYASVRIGKLEFFAEFAHKWVNVPEDKNSSTGTGGYSSLSFTGKGYGATLDYKDYRFDIEDPFGRSDYARPTRMLPFQNPPTVLKEHTYILLSRALHQVNFNDEVGLQIEGYATPFAGTTVTLNASAASEHNFFDYRANEFSFVQRTRRHNFLPSLEESLSPYTEMFLEAEHFVDERSPIRIAFARRVEVAANSFTGSANNRIIRSIVLPAQFECGLSPSSSLTFQIEQEWVDDNFNPGEEHYYNRIFAATFSRSPLTLTVRYEHTSNTEDTSGKQNWVEAEVGYRIGQSHALTVSYGGERGGLICSNGICRYFQPFVGFRMVLQSQL